MPDFTVDIGGLDALAKNLDRSCDNIDSATKDLADLAPSALGPEDLDTACTDFRDAWKDGLDELRDAVDEISEGLGKAKKSYADVEETIATNLREMREGLSEGGAQ